MKLPRTGKISVVHTNAEIRDTVEIMKNVALECKNKFPIPFMADAVINLHESIDRPLWKIAAELVFDLSYYEQDPPTLQTIRTPQRVIKDQRANCVDYSVFVASLLMKLGYNVSFKVVKFGEDEDFSHVYLMIDGIGVIDLVPSQNQSGLEHLLRNERKYPDLYKEVPYFSSFKVLINS